MPSSSSHPFSLPLHLAPLPSIRGFITGLGGSSLVIDKHPPPAYMNVPLLLHRNFRGVFLLKLDVAEAFLLLRVLPDGQADGSNLAAEGEGVPDGVFGDVIGSERKGREGRREVSVEEYGKRMGKRVRERRIEKNKKGKRMSRTHRFLTKTVSQPVRGGNGGKGGEGGGDGEVCEPSSRMPASTHQVTLPVVSYVRYMPF